MISLPSFARGKDTKHLSVALLLRRAWAQQGNLKPIGGYPLKVFLGSLRAYVLTA